MGFPSPAKDYQEDVIELSQYLVQHPTATFYFRVSGDRIQMLSGFSNKLPVDDHCTDRN